MVISLKFLRCYCTIRFCQMQTVGEPAHNQAQIRFFICDKYIASLPQIKCCAFLSPGCVRPLVQMTTRVSVSVVICLQKMHVVRGPLYPQCSIHQLQQ